MQGFCFYISIKKDNKIEYMSHTKKMLQYSTQAHTFYVWGEKDRLARFNGNQMAENIWLYIFWIKQNVRYSDVNRVCQLFAMLIHNRVHTLLKYWIIWVNFCRLHGYNYFWGTLCGGRGGGKLSGGEQFRPEKTLENIKFFQYFTDMDENRIQINVIFMNINTLIWINFLSITALLLAYSTYKLHVKYYCSFINRISFQTNLIHQSNADNYKGICVSWNINNLR